MHRKTKSSEEKANFDFNNQLLIFWFCMHSCHTFFVWQLGQKLGMTKFGTIYCYQQ